jgi:hypothetical protein
LTDQETNWLGRAESLVARLETAFTADGAAPAPDFRPYAAYRYRVEREHGSYQPVRHVDAITRADLIGVDQQWEAFDRNTRQLLKGLPCNHALLWGARGTGKSSLVKATLNEHAAKGLRLIEVRRSGLLDLASIVDLLADAPFAFLILLDDLSFEDNDPLARELKALLDGGVQAMPGNVRVVATANRRHLMPKRAGDNAWTDDDDLHVRDAAEEKASLADRFGLRLAFAPPTESWYVNVVNALAERYGEADHADEIRAAALTWGRGHGLSGRSARQFINEWVGGHRLADSHQ